MAIDSLEWLQFNFSSLHIHSIMWFNFKLNLEIKFPSFTRSTFFRNIFCVAVVKEEKPRNINTTAAL